MKSPFLTIYKSYLACIATIYYQRHADFSKEQRKVDTGAFYKSQVPMPDIKITLLVLLTFLFSSSLLAQEICDNGIDDDGDGLIDLNDPDCECSDILTGTNSLIPNPSFEDTLCCPINYSQLSCAATWIQASDATSDYYNACGYTYIRRPVHSPPASPIPGNGNGYVGFYNTSRSRPPGGASTNGTYKEYVGSCLRRPLRNGQVYTLDFFLSWAHGSDTLIVSIFGTPNCSELPWNGYGCPLLSNGSWVELGKDTVVLPKAEISLDSNGNFLDYDSNNLWTPVTISFTTPTDIYAVALGPSCDSTKSELENYYYADELTLSGGSPFSEPTVIEAGKWCTGDLHLKASIELSGGNWQWYRSGIALSGETSDSLNLMLYGINALYSVVYMVNGYCVRIDHSIDTTDPANWSRALLLKNKDTLICGDSTTISVMATATPGYQYQWQPTMGVSDPNSLTPEIRIGPDTSLYYELTASYPGCPDTSMGFQVSVQRTPKLVLPDDTVVCAGDWVALIPTVEPHRTNYQYTWSPAAGLQFNHTLNNLFQADSSITYTLEVSTPIGCTEADSIHITVQPDSFATAISDTGYCPPSAIPLWAGGGSQYHWQPAYGLDGVDIADPIASPATPTTYTVHVTNDFGCIDSAKVFVDVYPNAVLSMPDTIRLYPGEQYHLEPGTNCHYFNWFPTNGINSISASDPVFYPEVRTRYFVTARTEQGCEVRDSIDVLVEETVIDMPNAFVPGKGAVPVLKPARRGIAELMEFSVYNRWGNKVFSTKNIEEGWDGTFNGQPQPVGVYVYQIEAVSDSGQRFQKEGNVTLIR